MALDLTPIDTYDHLVTDVELDLVSTAKAHEAQPFDRLRSIPGVGKLLALVLLYEIDDIHRFPRVQAFVSYGRLVKGAKESAGKRYGTSGTKIGNAYLKGAVSEAAVLFLRNNAAGQKYLARLERRHGNGKALTVLAHKLARAVYYLVKRATAFDWDKVLHESWSGVGEPAASRDAEGMSLAIGARRAEMLRQRTHLSTAAFLPEPWPLIGRSLRLQELSRCSNMLDVCCPSPAPGTHWRMECIQPPL
jgi:transposase